MAIGTGTTRSASILWQEAVQTGRTAVTADHLIMPLSDASSATHSVWAAILVAFPIGSDQGIRPCFSFEQAREDAQDASHHRHNGLLHTVRVFIDSYNNPDRLATAVRRPGVLVQAG